MTPNSYKLNSSGTAAVATEVFWNEDMTTCPKGTKVQLLGAGGVAVYSEYHGNDDFWVGWCPVPRRKAKLPAGWKAVETQKPALSTAAEHGEWVSSRRREAAMALVAVLVAFMSMLASFYLLADCQGAKVKHRQYGTQDTLHTVCINTKHQEVSHG